MQNRYVADVGDFGKYGLLRHISRGAEAAKAALRMGFVWYLVPDEDHTNDGRHIGYLTADSKHYRSLMRCDHELFGALKEVLANGTRSVSAVQAAGLFPKDTIFFDAQLPTRRDGAKRVDVRVRLLERELWFDAALSATALCDLVFLDPDNGLECSIPKHDRNSSKYVFLDELSAFIQRKQSVIIYHHLGRRETAIQQVRKRLDQILACMDLFSEPLALLYRRGTVRAYIVIAAPEYETLLQSLLKSFLDSSWSDHFSLIARPTVQM